MSKTTKVIGRKIEETKRNLKALESTLSDLEEEKRSFEALEKTELSKNGEIGKFNIDNDLVIILNITGKHSINVDVGRKAMWTTFVIEHWRDKGISLKLIPSKLPDIKQVVLDKDVDLEHDRALNIVLYNYERTKHVSRKGGVYDITREKDYVRAIAKFVGKNPPSIENLRNYRGMVKDIAMYERFVLDSDKMKRVWGDMENIVDLDIKKCQRVISELTINLETYHSDLAIAKIDDEKSEGAKIKSLKGEAESLAEKIRGLGHAPKVDTEDEKWETLKATKKAVRGLSEQWKAICTELREERERTEERREQKRRTETLLKRAGKKEENAPDIANDESLLYILKSFDELPLNFIRGELHAFEQKLEKLIKAREEILRKAELYNRICEKLVEKKNIAAAGNCAERIGKIEKDVQSELSEKVIDDCNDRIYGEIEDISKLRDFERWLYRIPKEIKKSGKRAILAEVTVQTIKKLIPIYMKQKKVDFDKLELVFNYFQLLIEQADDMTDEQIKGVAKLISKEKYKTVDIFFKYKLLIDERKDWMSEEELERVKALMLKGQLKKVDKILAGVRVTRDRKAELKAELNWETWSDTRIYDRLRWLLRSFGNGSIKKGLEEAKSLSMGKPFRAPTSHTVKYVYKGLYYIGILTQEGNKRDSQVVVKSLTTGQEKRLKRVLELYEIIKEGQTAQNSGVK